MGKLKELEEKADHQPQLPKAGLSGLGRSGQDAGGAAPCIHGQGALAGILDLLGAGRER